MKLLTWWKQKTCSHSFDIKDLISRPTPDGNVVWPCWRCGKIFERHCGLEVIVHGTVINKPNVKAEPRGRE